MDNNFNDNDLENLNNDEQKDIDNEEEKIIDDNLNTEDQDITQNINSEINVNDEKINVTGFNDEKNKKKYIILIVSILIISIVASIGYFLYDNNKKFNEMVNDTINVSTYYEGIYVNGVNLGGKTKEQAKEELLNIEPSLRPNVEIDVECGKNNYKITNDDLSFDFTTDAVLEQAYDIGRSGKSSERYQIVQNLKVDPQIFTVECTLNLNNNSVEEYINKISDETNKEPKKPYVSYFSPNSTNMFTYSNGETGLELDKDDLNKKINNMLTKNEYIGNINAVVNTIPIPSSKDDPPLTEQTNLVSQFSTTSTNNAAGNNNMKLALNATNGKIIKPGEVFSFNDTTGDTTSAKNGYQPAKAIVDGEYVDEYGGGICQASTTIYGAALRADMEIVKRSNHRYPSNYVPLGQDATISYRSTDLKFKNSSEYPIFIKSWMSGKELNVQIYGYHPKSWDKIEVESSGNEDRTYAEGKKIFYKNQSIVKTEAILPSHYKIKE